MKVVLADTHGPVLGRAQTSANLSLLYLASYLQQQIPGVQVTYLPQKRKASEHFEIVERLRPDVYGISFTSFGAPTTYRLIRALKKRFPWLRVVLGGHHATPCPREALEKSGAEIAVIGEGELTFAEVVKRIADFPRGFAEIDGIAFFDEGRYVKTTPRELVPDIDSLPFPNRDLIETGDYTGLAYSRARPNTEMCVVRGCPLRCVFCPNPIFRVDGAPSYRARSPKSVALEAQDLYDRGYREIYMHSDELNVRLDWSIEVCRELAALGKPDLFFQTNMRVQPLSAELARALRDANFWMVRFGIESANDRVLRGIKKASSLEAIERACGLVSEAGIKVFGFFMMFQIWEEDGELQFETADEVRRSIEFARRLFKEGKMHYSTWGFTLPVQGAELHDIALRHGIVTPDYYPSDTWNIFEHLPHVSKREFNQLYKRARRLQAQMALKGGAFELRNWMAIARKARAMLFGKPDNQTEFLPPD